MMRLLRAACVALLLGTRVVPAQTILRLPASPRALGMGNVAVAGRDDDVLFYNPSQLVIARGMSASVERMSSSEKTGSLSSVVRFNTGGIAVGMRIADLGASAFRLNPVGSGLLDTLRATTAEAIVGLAQVFKTVRWGVGGKYVVEQLGDAREGRAMYDLGLSRDFFRFYTLALAAQNLPFHKPFPFSGPRFTGGAATSRALGPYDVVATAAVAVDRYNRKTHVAPAAGTEIGWSWISGYSVAGRLGWRSPLAGERAFTAGAALNADRLSIDYAMETLTNARVGHRIGLRIR